MITIGLVDEHTLYRKSLRKLLIDTDNTNLTVLFDVSGYQELAAVLHSQNNGVVLPDICLIHDYPPYRGIKKNLSFLNKNSPLSKVICITKSLDRYHRIDLMKQGVKGFIAVGDDVEILLRAITSVAADSIFIPPADPMSGPVSNALTEKQIIFLQLCISVMNYQEIANKMFLSLKTIENYRENLFRMLDVKSRTGLALKAIELGLFVQAKADSHIDD